MGFLDDLIQTASDVFMGTTASGTLLPGVIGPQPIVDEEFFGMRPGFDLGDIPDVLSRFFRGAEQLATSPLLQLGVGGQQTAAAVGQTEVGATAEKSLADIARTAGVGGIPGRVLESIRAGFPDLNGGNGMNGKVNIGSTAVMIGGSCPGAWHRTRERVVFDRHTGAARQVGGTSVANRVTLFQNPDTGQLEFLSPMKATFTPKYKSRRRRHHHHARAHSYRPKRKGGHRHKYTRKQLAAGFGGKKHRAAHR